MTQVADIRPATLDILGGLVITLPRSTTLSRKVRCPYRWVTALWLIYEDRLQFEFAHTATEFGTSAIILGGNSVLKRRGRTVYAEKTVSARVECEVNGRRILKLRRDLRMAQVNPLPGRCQLELVLQSLGEMFRIDALPS